MDDSGGAANGATRLLTIGVTRRRERLPPAVGKFPGYETITNLARVTLERPALRETKMFSGAHLHLLVNHAPIFLSIFACALFILSYFAAPQAMRRTALVVLVFAAIAGVLADKTGEPAEDAIRGYPGVQRKLIHDHEEMAEKAYYLAAALGVLAVGGIVVWRKKPVPAGVNAGMILASAFVSGAMIYTGLLGGRIRHTEIRPGAVKADALTIEPPRRRPPPAQPQP